MGAKDIQKGINLALKKAIEGTRFSKVPIAPDDDSEDIRRPSIRLVIETSYSREMSLKIIDTSVDVFFYAENSDRYIIDYLEFEDLMQNAFLFEGILIGEEIVIPLQIDCRTVRGVHTTSFTIQNIEIMNNDEKFEELEEISLGLEFNRK